MESKHVIYRESQIGLIINDQEKRMKHQTLMK